MRWGPCPWIMDDEREGKGGRSGHHVRNSRNWEISQSNLNKLIDFTKASRPAHANQEARIGGGRGSNLTGVKHKHDDVRSVSA